MYHYGCLAVMSEPQLMHDITNMENKRVKDTHETGASMSVRHRDIPIFRCQKCDMY